MMTLLYPTLCDWMVSRLGGAVWREIMAEIRRVEGATWREKTVPEVGVVGPEALKSHVAPHLWNLCMVADKLGQECRYDRVLVGHALEHEDADALLATVAQVLRPDGVAVLVVPHRGGVWAMRGKFSPFGAGRPYSVGQLERALEDVGMRVLGRRYALWAPPVKMCWVGRGGRVWPRFFRWLLKRRVAAVGGVLVVSAVKDVVGGRGLKVERGTVKTVPLTVPTGATLST